MKFNEYNTDENYDNEGSTADELIRLAKEEGLKKEDFNLSPKWAEDKNGYVAKAIAQYYPDEEKEPEIVAPKEESKGATESFETPAEKYLEEQREIADNAEDAEMARQEEEEQKRLDSAIARYQKLGDSFTKIDDHYLENLPKTLRQAYKSGQFGDPDSKEAKQARAYFAMNNIGAMLKGLSNSVAIAAGKTPPHTDVQSDWQKIRETNLSKGLENRWKKNEQSTQTAIDMLKSQGMNEQDIQNNISKATSNARLTTAFNMMNDKQKVFTLQVMEEIGDDFKNMDKNQFFNTLYGYLASGEDLSPQDFAAMTVGKFAPEVVDKGKEAVGDLLDKIGIPKADGEEGSSAGMGDAILAGIGFDNPSATLSNGEKVDYGVKMSKEEVKDLQGRAIKLGNDYISGKITEEQYLEDYTKLYKLMNEHGWARFSKGGINPPKIALSNMNRIKKRNNKKAQKEAEPTTEERKAAAQKAKEQAVQDIKAKKDGKNGHRY